MTPFPSLLIGGRAEGRHGECRMEDFGESGPGRCSGLSGSAVVGASPALGRIRGGRR